MTATPPATPPAQVKPVGGKKKKKRKWGVDQGLATIVGAVIGVAGSLLVVHFTASSASPAPAVSTSSSVPVSVSIDSPVGKIKQETYFTGGITNLQPDESVWVFFQAVDKSGNINPVTYPTSGPCVVDFAKNTWNCDDVYVGKITDSGTYRICPAVLNSSQSNEVVKLLEAEAVDPNSSKTTNNKSPAYWFNSPPPYINQQICISVPRTN
jgi:hypothetical protein